MNTDLTLGIEVIEPKLQPYVRTRSLTKRFPGATALDQVNFLVHRGEIHALVGENGAGKSTLIQVLMGYYQPDRGTIEIDGKIEEIKGVWDARKRLSIDAVFQDSMLLPQMSVYENMFLGNEVQFYKRGILSKKGMIFASEVALQRVLYPEGRIDVKLPVANLTVFEETFVAIARALCSEPKILVLDEVTAKLTEREVEIVSRIMRELADKGFSVIFVSHRLDEILELCDTATVLRDGKLIARVRISETSKEDLVRLITGKEATRKKLSKWQEVEGRSILFKVRNLESETGVKVDKLDIRENEIVALAGLRGQGQTECLDLMFGIGKGSCEIFIKNERIRIRSPRNAIRAGLVYLSDDVTVKDLFQTLSVRKNMAMGALASWSRLGWLEFKKEKDNLVRMINRFRIKGSLGQEVGYLSGGNRQKVAIAKWLLTHPKVVMLNNPTKGLDVGAKEEVYRMLRELAAEGYGLLLVLEDIAELLSLPHRVIVMKDKRIAGILGGEEITKDNIVRLSMG